jgi:hypothetical protein
MAQGDGSAYAGQMNFTFQMFWSNPSGSVKPLLGPLTLVFSSARDARRALDHIVRPREKPVHSVTLASADGVTSERWFQIDGSWSLTGD